MNTDCKPDFVGLVTVRDGVGLHTEVFLPIGGAEPSPCILIRTPYPPTVIPYGNRPIAAFLRAGYSVVVQACRGTWRSEGKFRFMQTEGVDGYDSVEWIAHQQWSNGSVGMYGASYSGSVQWLAARLNPPHLRCIAPLAPGAMFFLESPYLGGVFVKRHFIEWPTLITGDCGSVDEQVSEVGETTPSSGGSMSIEAAFSMSPNDAMLRAFHEPDMADALIETLEHSTLDRWWDKVILDDQSARLIEIPSLSVTGFHDGDQAGCIHAWSAVEKAKPESRRERHLIIGPWRHDQVTFGQSKRMKNVEFGPDASLDMVDIHIAFFDRYLKGEADQALVSAPRCRLFVSGENRWHGYSDYPPRECADTALYLHGDGSGTRSDQQGTLQWGLPADESSIYFVADWRNPVPVVDIGADSTDQLDRDDVLVYTSAPLKQPLTVLGPVSATIFLSVDAPDADLVVRIEDVRPDGKSVNMTGEYGLAAFRARYHEGYDREVLLSPGEPERMHFHVCHMGHTFQAGHSIRLVITGTAAELLEPNHHTGEPVLTAVERRTATETVYHDRDRPSHLTLPILQASGEVVRSA